LNGIANHYAVPEWRPDVEVNVYIGQTGSGKTYRAFKEAAAAGAFYIKNARTKWWDGYKGEANVVIDEFAPKTISITYLLTWLQEYPASVEIKGSTRCLKGRKFWITSNLHPNDWFPEDNPEHVKALMRRITKLDIMNEKYVAPTVEDDLNNIFEI